MMMPPKKSKAARKEELRENGTDDTPPPAPAAADSDMEEEQDEGGHDSEAPHKNIFDTEIVEGKRERTLPLCDKKLNDWLYEHFEDRDETRISIHQMYTEYVDNCQGNACPAVEDYKFRKIVKETFPKGVGVKEKSEYRKILKEKKVSTKSKKPKVQAESLQLKMKDVIHTTIKELGNPKSGLRFNAILKFVAGRWPALQIELKPHMLNNALQAQIRYGNIVCVRGIGKCGFYRIPVPGEEEEERKLKEEERKAKKEKKLQEEGAAEGDKEAGAAEGEEKEGGEAAAEEEVPKASRGAKRRAQESISGSKKKKSKKGKAKRKEKKYRKFVVHSDPQRVEDCFELAMTFMAEPKEASVGKIKKYLNTYYDVNNLDSRVKTCMENGCEKGYWEQITGTNGAQGTFRLTLQSFDPSDDDNLYGMVINAIMASVEPKTCSALLLKRYIMDYHPHLKVADRPHLFKKALERAVSKGKMRQLSGLGCSGTFMLVNSFVPSPTILQGEDNEETYESETEEEDSDDDDDDIVEYAVDVKSFIDRYRPRPTKRSGRQDAAGIDAYGHSVAKIVKPPAPIPKRPPPKVRRELPPPKVKAKPKQAAKQTMAVPTKASRKAPPESAAATEDTKTKPTDDTKTRPTDAEAKTKSNKKAKKGRK